jgi:hypothetical protein
MWRLAFIRPLEDSTLGSAAYLVVELDADGSHRATSLTDDFELAVKDLNATGYEPMSAAIDPQTGRWGMFWRKAEAPRSAEKKSAPAEEVSPAMAEAAQAIAEEAVAKRRPGRPKKAPAAEQAAAAPAAEAAPARRGPGRPRKNPPAAAPAQEGSAAPKRRGRPRKSGN